jgi:cysteine desulfuration protein SufE
MPEIDATNSDRSQLPPSIAKVLSRFDQMGREEKMASLVGLSKKLEPAPDRFLSINGKEFEVPECQTPLRLFSETNNGRIHFFAQIDNRQSPTVSAFLALVFSAVNDQPPETTLAIPGDFVRRVMQSIGLGTREVGLEAIIARLKRHARDAIAARTT